MLKQKQELRENLVLSLCVIQTMDANNKNHKKQTITLIL